MYSDVSKTQSRSTLPPTYSDISDTRLRSTLPPMYSDTPTGSTLPPRYSENPTASTMPPRYSDNPTLSTLPPRYSGNPARSILNSHTRSTMPFIVNTHTRSTMPFMAQTRSTMPFMSRTRSTMPFKYNIGARSNYGIETRSTMPFMFHSRSTRSTMYFKYSTETRSTFPFIYPNAQSRSTLLSISERNNQKFNGNKKVGPGFYSIPTNRPIIQTMQKQRQNGHFINVYNYMRSHKTSSENKDVENPNRPQTYKFKQRAFDDAHPSMYQDNFEESEPPILREGPTVTEPPVVNDYEVTETPIELYPPNYHQNKNLDIQRSRSEFTKDESLRFSTPRGRPMLEVQSNDATKSLGSAIEKFKEPLQKLASMKASFYYGEDNPFKKEIELANDGNLFDKVPTIPPENVNKKIPLNVERLDDTQSDYPLMETEPAVRYRGSDADTTCLPEIQTTASPIYPWLLTKMFTATANFRKRIPKVVYEYEYKEQERPEPRPKVPSNVDYSQIRGMPESESESFSVFLAKLMKVLASKSLKHLPGLINPFERTITLLLDSGKLMKLGMTIGTFIVQFTTMLTIPMKEIQRQLFIMQISLENRRRMLDDAFNTMMDELDNVYDVDEEEAMQRVLQEATMYPNTSKTGEQIVEGFIDDVFLKPMNRIAGTAQGNVVFENIAKVANKYNTPQEPLSRRFQAQYQVTAHNKFRHPSVKNDIYLRNRRKNKEKQKFAHPPKLVQSQNDEKEYIDMESQSNDEGNENESSSSDNNGVEIKIRINNKNVPRRNKRKILKANKEKNVDVRKTEVKDSEKENIGVEKYLLTNGNFRKNVKTTKVNCPGRKSNLKGTGPSELINEDRGIIKSEVNGKETKESEVKLQFDCKPLPLFVSKTNEGNRQSDTGVTTSEMLVYCSNAVEVTE
ncbi:uncharacterized protein LOC125239272 [Leguminivora glycinivorella]|uniref:uncharacterized protein LOC125239272 n=1 Tax=Leguminivora glycinivorella TaxID=1035111 RepID=UPI00200EDE5E|nr:uncharacterized protein LOC125239272 [Leguminivora glycinivorella]